MARYQSGDDFGEELGRGVVVVVAMLVIIAVIAIVSLVVATLIELVRVYREHAGPTSPIARTLWLALACLGGSWLVAALLALAGYSAVAAYLAAWSFLAYVVGVEVLARSQGQPLLLPIADPQLTDVLEPWYVTPSSVDYEAFPETRVAA